MNLTKGQEEALAAIRDLNSRFPDGGGVASVSGYAGTGKTTMLKVLAEEYPGLTVLTPTGKAGVRVREATGAESSTIHRWMYRVTEDEKTGKLDFVLRDLGDIPVLVGGFVVVDEASMVGYEVFKNLYKFCKSLNLNLVLVGDGFQLPPVEMDKTKQSFSVFAPEFPAHVKVQLTEVLRQAQDNPIIRAGMGLRTGQWAQEALSGLPVVAWKDLNSEARRVWEEGGFTVCHRNATRNNINRAIRADLGYGDSWLEPGEPLLVTQNNYRIEVYNGEILTLDRPPDPLNQSPVAVRDRFKNASTFVNFWLTEVQTPVLGCKEIVLADKEVFGTLGDVGAHVVSREAKGFIKWKFDNRNQDDRPAFLHANLGYCLTAHKAQGSEAPEVLVVLESSIRLGSDEGRRWAYTALTRGQRVASICWE